MIDNPKVKEDVRSRTPREVERANDTSVKKFFYLAGWAFIAVSIVYGFLSFSFSVVLTYSAIGIVIIGIGEIIHFLHKIHEILDNR